MVVALLLMSSKESKVVCVMNHAASGGDDGDEEANHVVTTDNNDQVLPVDVMENQLLEKDLREPLLPPSPAETTTTTVVDATTTPEYFELTSDPRRFRVLTAYCLSSACNSYLSMSTAPIAEAVGDDYNVSVAAVNGLVLSFMILYGPGTWLA